MFFTEGINFYSSPKPYLAFGGGAYAGTVINDSPPAGSGPDPVNVSSPNATLELKPFNALDLQSSFTYTHFTNPDNGDLVYDNEQWISRWNYQATKTVSFNVIGQYISTLPNPTYTSLTNSKTLFADALLTYLPHPGTAIYLGYIGNFANIDSALCTRQSGGLCNSSDPILPPTDSSMMNDGKTIYLKITYLLHF